MELSSRDWALTLLMIQRLQQTCKAFEQMFGSLCLSLQEAGLSGEQIRRLNEEWDRALQNHIEDFSAKEDVTQITSSGVFKGTRTTTLEDGA